MTIHPLPDTELRPSDRARRTRVVLISAAAGILLAVIWSFELVDKVIGDNLAGALLGHDAREAALTGATSGLIFAFVSGFAGTFTACNIAIVASVGPLSQAARPSTGQALRSLLRPLGWLTLGMVSVSAAYGAIGVLLGDRLPQLSTEMIGTVPVRLIQSSVVFGIIGLALIYLGLTALGVLRDPFADRPVARVVAMGALIGGFLIGRPYPMFNRLFHWAADTGNPLYGALAFVLQSLGNILIVTAVLALVVWLSRGRVLQWMADPRRRAVVTGSLLIALGVFTVVYWDLRVPAIFGVGWFPMMPYR